MIMTVIIVLQTSCRYKAENNLVYPASNLPWVAGFWTDAVSFWFLRLLLGVGQGDGSSDLQHQQHDRTGALHTAGPPLAAPGRKAYSLARTRSLHAVSTQTHTHTPQPLVFSNMCSKTHKHALTDRHTYIQICTVCTHTHCPPLVLHVHTHTHTHVMNFSDISPTLCPFPTPACQKHWAI